ncbi:hypothetical protein CTEN210_02951 [Chaetoceros tenuissimus]|nr:hypothetical protein CTEN210_02951 [Chaetoceros tenuissimus]
MRSQLERIRSTKNIFSNKDRKNVVGIVQDTKERLVALVGSTLHVISFFQPKVTVLERMIRAFPKSLSTPHRETNLLPIQTAAIYSEGAKYIPVLAKVGQIHNVGGENQRGGLLTSYPDNWDFKFGIRRTLEVLLFHADEEEDKETEDMRYVSALKTLQEENLLLKEDVHRYDLLYASGWEQSKLRFKFILQLDPDALNKFSLYMPGHFMHGAMSRGAATMRAIFESTFECYPDQAGFLFQKDLIGRTVFQEALEKHGEYNTMSVIRDIISPHMDFPILHHALIAAPKFTSIFANWFPEAYSLRDSYGRSLIQAILAAGGKCVIENSIIFASISHDQIQERDPVTTLYPFAAVASGEDGDLQKSFYLLRRQPGVVNGMIPKNNTSKKRGKKRKKGKAE